jgi:hypothetical protein
MRAKARPRGERVNKGRCCALFGWSRYQFDQRIAEGMPYVEAAAHKGAEWVVDVAEVQAWLEERERARREYWRRRREEDERRQRELAEAEAARREAGRRAERERAERWEAERRAREEARLLDRAYRVCAGLARADYGYPVGTPMDRREHPRFDADWPDDRPPGWQPPPGMLEAIAAEPACKPYGYREPDWRRLWPIPYVPGRPWPWRDDAYREPVRPPR